MKKEDFIIGQKLLVEYVSYDESYKKKTQELIVDVIKSGSKASIKVDNTTVRLKNFKKDNSVRGSAGMILSQSGKSWLNFSVRVLGGVDYLRDKKIDEILN